MKNVWKIAIAGVLAVVLSACGNAAAKGNLTAQEVFEKAKVAASELQSVHTTVAFEDFWQTSAPMARMSTKYDFISDATLHPETFKQRLLVSSSDQEKWEANVYKMNDRIFIEKDSTKTLDELTSGTLSEMFGIMVEQMNPTLNLSFFDTFADDFELEPIDYGYNLRLSMSREQYEEFQKLVSGLDDISGEYAFINKFDIVIGIDINTFYTTDFKLVLDTTTYSTTELNGNSKRTKQTMTAVYSKYDHVEPIKLPVNVVDAAAQ
ncbi:DUF6612 family protein [Sporosarcina beigongshangi]|uniref:DUF6612 family protein n=1 Tax=Sporosarcina beigongshangi TaxID=2782538 RepID=UPI0019396C88|nr:DUF6612 family protein [Sporosarcina beigongshangi]